MQYLEWNDLIAERFFRPEMAGRKVFLYVSERLVEELGGPQGVGAADFVRAVKGGPPWVARPGLCYRAYDAFARWRHRNSAFPPYVGYLALFVLAAGLEGDFAPHAYYPRLRTLIGEDPVIGQYPYFSHMRALWDDLERWSQEDKMAELGIFNVILAGKWQHVGIPIAQTLLTQEEREVLPRLFLRAGLDPTSPPSDDELASLMRTIGANELRGRTLRVLAAVDDDAKQLREALTQIVLDELLDWNGTAQSEDRARAPGSQPEVGRPITEQAGRPDRVESAENYGGSLRLGFRYDRVSGRLRTLVRCRSVHPLPDEGLILTPVGQEGVYECDDFASGWSTPLRSGDDRTELEGTKFDWRAGMELVDTSGSWRFTFLGSRVRILVSGARYGLPDLVEERRLPTGAPFYLAADGESCTLITHWGGMDCTGFQEMPVMAGLPQGWRLFHADRANNDEAVRGIYSALALPRSTNLHFEGGVRVSAANQYFAFAPPSIIVTSADDAMELRCNGTPLDRGESPGHYRLPKDAPTGVRLLIEVRRGEDEVARKSLYLIQDIDWPGVRPTHRFNRKGELLPEGGDDSPVFVGALVERLDAPPFAVFPPIDRSTYSKAVLLGRVPGQVLYWPRQDLPSDWAPVWAVMVRKRGYAVFSGLDVRQANVSETDTGDRRMVAKWKEVLWYWRRRIKPPTDPTLSALWRKYQERARDV